MLSTFMNFLIQSPQKALWDWDTSYSHFTKEKAKHKEMLVKLPVSHNNYMTESGFKLGLKMHVLTLRLYSFPGQFLLLSYLISPIQMNQPISQMPDLSWNQNLGYSCLHHFSTGNVNTFHTWLTRTMQEGLLVGTSFSCLIIPGKSWSSFSNLGNL